MVASDYSLLAVYHRRYTVRYYILDIRMELFVLQAFLLRCIDYRLRHRMRKMLLKTCSYAKQFIRLSVAERNDICNYRSGFRKSSRLVEYYGISLSHGFHILAALYSDIVVSCFSHRGKHRDRHRQLERTRKIDHQHRKSLRHISGKSPYEYGSQQRVRHQLVSQMCCLSLNR